MIRTFWAVLLGSGLGCTDCLRFWTYFWTFLLLFLFLRPKVLSSMIFCFFAKSAFEACLGGISYHHRTKPRNLPSFIFFQIFSRKSNLIDQILGSLLEFLILGFSQLNWKGWDWGIFVKTGLIEKLRLR